MKKFFKSALVAFLVLASGSVNAQEVSVAPFSIGPGQYQTIKFCLTNAVADNIGVDLIVNLPQGIIPVDVTDPTATTEYKGVTFNESRLGSIGSGDFSIFWRPDDPFNMRLMLDTPHGITGTDGDWIFAIDVYADETVVAGDQAITFNEDCLFYNEADDFYDQPADVPVTVSDKFVVNIPASGWATLCSAVDLDITGLNVYAVTKAEGGKTEVEKIEGALKAGVGALIKGEAGKVEIPAGSGATEPETNFLVGVTKLTVNPNYGAVYFLKDGKFKKAAKSASLSAGKAYLEVPASSAKDFEELDSVVSDPTAIKAVETEQNAGVLYTLNGIRVDNPTKGVYIQNGRKVVVK